MKYKRLIIYLQRHWWVWREPDGYYMYSPITDEPKFKITNQDFKHLKYNNLIKQNELKRWISNR